MKKIESLEKYIFGDTNQISLERYFVTITTFVSSFFLLVLVFVNFFLGLNTIQIIVALSGFVLMLALYYFVRFRNSLLIPKIILTVGGLILLDFAWYSQFLSNGSVLFYILIFAALIIWIWNGKQLVIMLTFYFINLLVLFYVDSNAPEYLFIYPETKSREIDIFLNIFFYSMLLISLLYAVKREFLRQHKKVNHIKNLYYGLFSNTTIGLYQSTPSGEILSANPALIKMLKFDSLEDLFQRDISTKSYVEIDKRTEFKSIIHKYGEITDYESEWYTKNGDIIVVLEAAKAVKNKKGEIIRYDGTVEDITEKKKFQRELIAAKEKAEEKATELKKQQVLFETMFNTINEGVVITNTSREIVLANNGMFSIFGLQPKELIGKQTKMLYADSNKYEESGNIIFNENVDSKSNQYLTYYKRNDKTIFPGETFGAKLFDHNSNWVGNIGIIRDVTEREKFISELKIAKEKAEENELQLNTILKNSPTGFAINEISTGKVTYVNKAFANAYHIPIELCTDVSSFIEYVYADQMDLRNKLVSDLNSEDPLRMKWDMIPIKDKITKSTHYVSASNIILKEIDLMISTVVDITSQIKNENELKLAKEKAEESDRLKSAFLANMSHEIRTPMNGILGFTNLLNTPDLTGEEHKKYIDIIKKSGGRMLNTVNDIIDISRIESGLVDLYFSEVNINEQLKYLHSFFQPEAMNKGIQLIYKNDNSEQDYKLITDIEKFNSIVTNLIKNAIKFTNQGTIELGYSIKKKNESAQMEFYIKDSGIGIPKNRQKAIFDRFVQADIEDVKANQGSGLGLAISKAYTEMLGGKIWVDSEERKGTTFYFTLEYNSEPKIKSITKNDIETLKENNISDKLKILIVEDDETSQNLISILVEELSEKIINVSSGLEAVEVCRNNADIDVILMDIQLPELNGYEASQQIRKFNKDVVIIAQTAYALAGDKEKAINSGCNDYISKPIDKDELFEKIENCLNK